MIKYPGIWTLFAIMAEEAEMPHLKYPVDGKRPNLPDPPTPLWNDGMMMAKLDGILRTKTVAELMDYVTNQLESPEYIPEGFGEAHKLMEWAHLIQPAKERT